LQYSFILLNDNNKDDISSAKTDAGKKYILNTQNKGFLEDYIAELNKIVNNYTLFSLDLTTIKDLYKNKAIQSISDFVAVKKNFSINNSSYSPSSGEKSILALQREFLSKTKKNVFLIDEPELGLGSTYINTSIIPLIKSLAKQKKIIVLATHDPNIAVRTRPLNSILKLSHNEQYFTYIGNMFTEELKNIDNEKDVLSWKKPSIKYLEGGEPAFEERGELYEQA